MTNLLLEDVAYQEQATPLGIWRRYLYPSGAYFAEFRTHRQLLGLPLIHYTRGICPQTGRRIVAKGIVAVGRRAAGLVAIGQAAFGVVAIGQLAVGLGLALGQAALGSAAVGQLALGVLIGVGQLATGLVAVGQFGMGRYVLAQIGVGGHVWSQQAADPQAVSFFRALGDALGRWRLAP